MLGNKDSVSLGTQHRKPGSTREAFRRSAIGNDGANVRPVRCASKEPGSPSKPITTHAHHASTSFLGPTNPTAELSSSIGRGHQGRPSDAERETYLTGHREHASTQLPPYSAFIAEMPPITSAQPSITKANVKGKAHGHERHGRVGELLPPYSAFIAEMPPHPGTHFLHKANHTFFLSFFGLKTIGLPSKQHSKVFGSNRTQKARVIN